MPENLKTIKPGFTIISGQYYTSLNESWYKISKFIGVFAFVERLDFTDRSLLSDLTPKLDPNWWIFANKYLFSMLLNTCY